MELITLVFIVFLTSIISVVTGSTSLITVPVLIQFGIEPRSAIATNMLALTLMSIGASLSFRSQNVIKHRRIPLLTILTLAGSILGALLLLIIPSRVVPVIVSILMIAMALFLALRRNTTESSAESGHSRFAEITGYTATFALGVYGGFFSGGYVTMLTASFVALFGMTFLQAVSTTKLLNVFSSLAATLIFMCQRLVDYQLGILIGIVMFIGGIIGGRLALKLSNLWLQRIFLAVVFALALKILIYDFFQHS
jgi:uncharacterized protein